ncbi:ATP-binding protein [Candidatus Pacearchaeota archaeon]|nr:ATP-binding protein [Candidatus Pacearchaeota archaeon]
MINNQDLRRIVLKQKEEIEKLDGAIKRDILDEILNWFKDNRVIILTGIRRCGKSTLLRQIMNQKKNYCYVNFEDERFLDFKAQDFEKLNEILIEIYNNPKIYFFDEVQNIDKFETFVRRLQDEGKKVVITGSNASLLSKEFGTRLTGRYKLFEIYPFSFSEYLLFKNVEIEKNWSYKTQKRVEIKKAFNEYLEEGGFPEYLKTKDKEYIKNVFDNILYKDVIARYAIKKQKVIKELISILATNISSTFTYNSIKTALNLGNSITVKEYIYYLANSYFLFELPKFDFSLRKSLNAPKKAYLIDTAFNQITGFNFSPNVGKNLENVVFIELKRRRKEVYYFSEKNECDFVIKDGSHIILAIQVCYDLNKDNRDREVKGLLAALNNFKLKDGFIITSDQEENFEQEGKKIKVMPVWKWLLEYKSQP